MIRVLRVLEYEYASLGDMERDMSHWNLGATGSRAIAGHGSMVRSATFMPRAAEETTDIQVVLANQVERDAVLNERVAAAVKQQMVAALEQEVGPTEPADLPVAPTMDIDVERAITDLHEQGVADPTEEQIDHWLATGEVVLGRGPADPGLVGEELDGFNMTPRTADGSVADA